ncbi:MAG: class I SAM-dependent methyltransferase [Patescibacteria group bacterium]|nr:class I SAM-dependent methyltransferase [Patescibacteria group bacterium]
MKENLSAKSYQNNAGAEGYVKFIDSPDGETFKKVLGSAISRRLEHKPHLDILDAGCGPGWLAYQLDADGHRVIGCDASPQLIAVANSRYPKTKFETADLTMPLPYRNGQFDAAILSLSALDLHDQAAAFQNLRRVLKPDGLLLMTIVNPYYGFPVGVWKRGWWRFLTGQTPKLRLRPYNNFLQNPDRNFTWNNSLISYFYTLPEQVNAALAAGFSLNFLQDVVSGEDEKNYSLRHRLYRFPIFLLLEFKAG